MNELYETEVLWKVASRNEWISKLESASPRDLSKLDNQKSMAATICLLGEISRTLKSISSSLYILTVNKLDEANKDGGGSSEEPPVDKT